MIQGFPSLPNFRRDWVRETEASRRPWPPPPSGENPKSAPGSTGKGELRNVFASSSVSRHASQPAPQLLPVARAKPSQWKTLASANLSLEEIWLTRLIMGRYAKRIAGDCPIYSKSLPMRISSPYEYQTNN